MMEMALEATPLQRVFFAVPVVVKTKVCFQSSFKNTNNGFNCVYMTDN
jgi:hypothetical protein